MIAMQWTRPYRFLKHWLGGTNAHGVHSPFVYAYVTKCLYAKARYRGTKAEKVLFKSLGYFGASRVKLPEDADELGARIRQEFPGATFDQGPYDLVYAPIDKELFAHQVHNDTLVLLDGINKKKGNTERWTALRAHPSVTVSIDMYHCGALFFRREQAKEHFRIRI